MELEKDRLARGHKRYSLYNSVTDNAEFKEDEHPRGDDGKFGTGGKGKTEKSKEKPKAETKAKKDSNLSTKQQKQTQSPEFKQWFGKSKVVDKNGEPLVVYHGSDEEFESFNKPKDTGNKDRVMQSGDGIYFMDDKEMAQRYGKNLKETFIKLENPIDKTKPVPPKLMKYINKTFPNTKNYSEAETKMKFGSVHRVLAFLQKAGHDTSKVLSSMGYDGVISGNGIMTEYVAFDPKQIKSATGNKGSFDPESDNINNSCNQIKVYRARK